MTDTPTRIAVIGGTGALGAGLALRWARAGHDIIIGSRSPDRAAAAAQELGARSGGRVRGMANGAAAEAAEIVVLAVPFASHDAMLAEVRAGSADKILIDATVPLVPPRVSTVTLPAGGSVAQAAQELLGDEVRVVSAFQNIAAERLSEGDTTIDCDVLVCGNDAEARETVVGLAASAGLRAWHAGPIANSVIAEALTSALIFINRHYKIDGAGIRITGDPSAPSAADR